MDIRQLFSSKKADLVGVVLSLLVLLPCLYYPYLSIAKGLNFLFTLDWIIVAPPPCPGGGECLQAGDRLLSIGNISHEDFVRSRWVDLLEEFDEDGYTNGQVSRNGRLLTIRFQGRSPSVNLRETSPVALFPLFFWLLGTATMIFLRPRDERWLVLILFSYLTAVWFAAGAASSLRTAGAGVVFHLFIWLFLPLAVHLHLILPSPLWSRRARNALLIPLYGGSLLLTGLDFFQLLGRYEHAFVLTTLAGVVLSLGLLIVRLFLPQSSGDKFAQRVMLFGVILGLGPFLFFFGLFPRLLRDFLYVVPDVRALYPWIFGISLLSIPILPMSYVYAISKHHLGALEFRPNRLLGVYTFWAVSITSYVVSLFLVSSHWAPVNDRLLAAILALSLVFVASVPILLPRVQALMDRHVFGIRHSSDQVIDLVSERIPKAFDRAALAQVIVEEILPTLLIRQSALYVFEENRQEALYEQAVPPGQPAPSTAELREMLRHGRRYLHPSPEPGFPQDWVRLVIPLALQAETIGVWLIGRRDPDDHYPASDIHLLSTVANQIAPMVENIRLYEKAQQEIAQRKAAEEEIRRSEERFRTLFEATLEGIAIVRNGVILEVNHALGAIFGFSPGELIDRRLSDLVSETEAGLDGVPREGLGFRADGSSVDIEIAGKKYVFQGEDVTVVAIRDIALRKRNEAENKMLQRQLLHSQKMEAIGRLSAGVAHDFNNCLLAIFGYSELLLGQYGDDLFLARNLNGIKEAGQKAAALTKQLLAFARRQPLETRVMDLNLVVSGLTKMLQRLLGEDIALIGELQPDLPCVKIDPGQIEQVIVNLAVNARHAMPEGGRLTIRTSAVEITAENAIPRANLLPGGYVLLSVEDTGLGMDAETQARVFEPFFSTKGEGTGLGLSTAYGIVRQSGGHIAVDSAPGRGATFSIYLPVTRERETLAGVTAIGRADSGSETILLVEDEDEVRRVLFQILSGKGYRVFQAASGEEALAMSRLHRGPLHLLLTDVIMPRMKGPELAELLLADRPQTRVLFMSGYNEEPLLNAGSGPLCLQKPFPPDTLTDAVRSLLDEPAEPAASIPA